MLLLQRLHKRNCEAIICIYFLKIYFGGFYVFD